MRFKLLEHLMMSAPCCLEHPWLSYIYWLSLILSGVCQDLFFLVYQLRIWLKIFKVKIFWNHPMPFIASPPTPAPFFLSEEGEWISGPPLFTYSIIMPCKGRAGKGWLSEGLSINPWMDLFLLLWTPSSTWLLIFTSDVWNTITTSYCQELGT